jgi:hypothetical protein
MLQSHYGDNKKTSFATAQTISKTITGYFSDSRFAVIRGFCNSEQ